MFWDSIFNTIKALGQIVGLVRDTREAAGAIVYEPVDAAKARAGTEAGVAATAAGRKAGKR
jgi:hypothetical protein